MKSIPTLALAGVLCAATGCFRTVYHHLEPPTYVPTATARVVREDSSWQHFFLYGWVPSERVINAASECGGVERVQDIFMHSPPHRENLLNAGFNVAGFGVVRNGDNLYVTQDFGHNLPAYSSTQADAVVRAAVESRRAADRLSQLQALDGSSARQAACAMAQSNALNAQAPQARYILRYTAETPGQLPSNASRAIDDPAIRAYAVGSCFARTASYPSGAYWVLLLFY